MTKAPTPTEMSKGQSDNANNAIKSDNTNNATNATNNATNNILVKVAVYFNYLVSVTAGGPRSSRGHVSQVLRSTLVDS